MTRKCLLCGFEKLEEEFCNAHIIPKQLYSIIRKGGPKLAPDYMTPEQEKKLLNKGLRIYYPDLTYEHNQGGITDGEILCKCCDNGILGTWDAYGQKFLMDTIPKIARNNLSQEFITIDTFDYDKIKLFFMSILWRSAITKDKFFEFVKLGECESKLKTMISAKNPGNKNDFSIIIIKYKIEFLNFILAPQIHEKEGTIFYEFRLPNYSCLIKVGEQPFPADFDDIILQRDKPLRIRQENYEETPQYQEILEIFQPNS